MSVERGDTRATSEVRIWQLYADKIGIPGADTVEVPARRGEGSIARRHITKSTRRVLGTVVIVVITASAGTAYWRIVLPNSGTSNHPSVSGTSRSLEDADGNAAHATQTAIADNTLRTEVTTTAPNEAVGAHTPRPFGDSASNRAISGPATANSLPIRGTERSSFMHRLNFDFDSARINNDAKPALDGVIATLKAHPEWRVTIEGYTDRHGTRDYNQKLSERRALAVKAQLESAGIAPNRLTVLGFGASHSVASSESLAELLNRRVEIHRP